MPIDRNSAQYITGATYKPTQTSAPGVWDLDDQANNIAKNLWPLPPQAIQRSLRFNSADNAYLNRTPVASNRTTWTWSAWIKICTFDTYRGLFTRGDSYIYLNSNNKIEINLRNAATNYFLLATPVYRDPTAWYHIVVALDTNNGTAADRLKLYVNNVRVQQYDISTYQNISTGYEPLINSAAIHYIGGAGTAEFNGYMAEVNFVDSQALTPASFGETDQQTGVWIPKRYLGTYGTNGFRLSFANNSSTTALGYDSSGAGNNWTANNFSVTPGVNNDVFVDVPSLYGTDTGLGGEVLGNYCTINTLMQNTSVATISDGALRAVTGTTGVSSAYIGTIGFNSGKWYWEVHVEAIGTNNMWIGVTKNQANRTVDAYLNTWTYNKLGQKTDNSATGSTYGATYTSGDIIGVAVDADAGSITFYKNGVSQGIAFTGLSMSGGVYTIAGSDNSATMVFNFGQRPFTYAAPAGFKALCTTNLPAPAIGQTSSNQADNHFNVVTWTGNGSSRTITGVGFQPDLIWIKNRSQGAASTQYAHNLYDTVRGINAGGSPILQTNLTDPEITYSGYGVSAVNADGFSLIGNGSLSNFTGDNYVAWCWNAGGISVTNNAGTNGASVASTYRANRAAGFSIVTYTGTGVGGATIAHGLGVAPKLIITKARVATGLNWAVYHAFLGATKNLWLSNGDSVNTQTVVWNDTAPSSAVFTVGSAGNANSTQGVVAYCWAEIPGYSAFGSYTGNGSTDGPFVYLGFRPKFILIKNTSISGYWNLQDSARNTSNPADLSLFPNVSDAEQSGSGYYVDFLSNGFKLRALATTSHMNGSGNTIIYAAFAETPARLSSAR